MENLWLSNWRSLAWTDSQEFMNFHGVIGCEEQFREIWPVWKWRYSNKHMKSSQKKPVWNVQLLDGIGYQIHGFRFLQESQVLECGWLRCPGGGDFTQFGSITHISKESIEHSAEHMGENREKVNCVCGKGSTFEGSDCFWSSVNSEDLWSWGTKPAEVQIWK